MQELKDHSKFQYYKAVLMKWKKGAGRRVEKEKDTIINSLFDQGTLILYGDKTLNQCIIRLFIRQFTSRNL